MVLGRFHKRGPIFDKAKSMNIYLAKKTKWTLIIARNSSRRTYKYWNLNFEKISPAGSEINPAPI